MTDGSKIIQGMKEAIKSAGCAHANAKQVKPGKWECPDYDARITQTSTALRLVRRQTHSDE